MVGVSSRRNDRRNNRATARVAIARSLKKKKKREGNVPAHFERLIRFPRLKNHPVDRNSVGRDDEFRARFFHDRATVMTTMLNHVPRGVREYPAVC